MSAVYNSVFLVRWVLYLVRWMLRCAYGVLQFLSKPGSRIIIPALVAGLMFLQRPGLHVMLGPVIDPYTDYTTQPWMLDGLLIILLMLFTAGYAVGSRVLALVLGAFPQMARPLAPQRRYEATKPLSVSVPVKLVVPALPPRQSVKEAAT